MQRLRKIKTVWSKDDDTPEAIQSLVRIALPLYDLTLVLVGIIGVIFGAPAISEVFDPHVMFVGSLALIVSGIAALIGVVIPRLWVAEQVGKIVIVVLDVGYIGSLLGLTVLGDGNRAFIAAFASLAIYLPAWRLLTLPDMAEGRRARKLVSTASAAAKEDQ